MANQNINQRLNRLEGQISGISKMVQIGEKGSVDIVIQILAVKSALEKVGALLLAQDIENGKYKEDELQRLLDYLVKLG